MDKPTRDTRAIALADEQRAITSKLLAARTRLLERLEEVRRRLARTRDAMDVAQLIRARPMTAVGIGLLAGALASLPRTSTGDTLPGKAGGWIVGVAVALAKARLGAWTRGYGASRADAATQPTAPTSDTSRYPGPW